jgi:hypothetical protein
MINFAFYRIREDLVDDETGYVKEYMLVNNIEQSRMLFRIRTKMLELKVNIKGRYENNLSCKACSSSELESQSHVLDCPAYEELRNGLDLTKDKDMVTYFSQVMQLRMKKK